MTPGVYLCYSDLFDCHPTMAELVALIRRVPLRHAAWTLARLNMALRFALQPKERETFGPVQQILIEAHLDDEALSRLRARYRDARCDERPVFLPHCVLGVLRLVMLHSDPEPQPRDEDDAFVRYTIGRACLMMNNLLLNPEEEQALLKGSEDKRRIELMVQTMSSFELTNSPRADHLVPRLQIMYRILLRDAGVRAKISQRCEGFDFEVEFRTLLGVSIETWLFVIYAIYAYYLNAANALAPNPTYVLIDPATFCGESGITQDVLNLVLHTLSATAAEIRNAVQYETVTDSRYDFVSFRSRPIVRIGKNKYLAVDLSFILEKCHTGVQWSIHDRLPVKRRQTVFNAWGVLFEEYVHWLLEGMKTGLSIRYFRSPKWKNSADESFDGLFLKGNVMVAAEYKGGFLPREARYSGDSGVFLSALNKKFSVGCVQLAEKTGRLFAARHNDRGELNDVSLDHIRSVIPVLVLQDHIFRVPFLNWYLNARFQECLSRFPLRDDVVIRPLTVIHIHELESIVHSVESEDFDFVAALQLRTYRDPEVLSDLLDFLSTFDKFGHKPSPRLKRVLDQVQDDLTSYLFPHHKLSGSSCGE
ncbi:MAG: hypothetical protein WBG54_04590 [Acidobacteriaceae bacterium]